MSTFGQRLRRLPKSDYLTLCVGTHVMRASIAAIGTRVFGPDRIQINAAGGDLPKTLGVHGIKPILDEVERIGRTEGFEYATRYQQLARLAMAEYFGLSPDRIFFAGGLSSFSRELFEKHRILHRSDAMALHACASHPLFYQDAHFNLGRFDVIEVSRLANGKIDLEHLAKRLEEHKGKKILVSIVPWENPTGIIYDEAFFTENNRGFFEQLAKYNGYIWLYLDCMYHDFDFRKSMSVKKLVEMATEYQLVGAVGVGLSKIMLGPGLRGAGIGIFGDSEKIGDLHKFLVRWETSTINSGVSNATYAALYKAFSGDEEVKTAIADLKGKVEVLARANREVLLATSGIRSAYPDAPFDCAFYQLMQIEGTRWSEPSYTIPQWNRFRELAEAKIAEEEALYTSKGWDPRDAAKDVKIFLESRRILAQLVGYEQPHLGPDESFNLDLMEQHGISLAPGNLFFGWNSSRFPLGPQGERFPILRTVLSHNPDAYHQMAQAIASLLAQG